MKDTPVSAATQKRYKISIVDDHPIVREGLADMINGEKDLTVCCMAEDIPQAIKNLDDCRPDAVIIDLTLGESNGLRLIKHVADTCSDMPVLVYSMHDEVLYAERCIQSGARGYIMKKEPSRKVLSALRTILQGNIYVSNTLSESFLDNISERKKEYNKSPIELLGNRELEVYQLLGNGMKKRPIAEKLNISLKTVENHISHIKKKMHFKDFHDLLRHAFQNDISSSGG